ncbi:MAG TPA: ABC transporter permease [Firmicutes bacterium]|nr:ABC transporter permease [Bacillota bacterium]
MLILRAEIKKIMADYRNYLFNYIIGNLSLFMLAAGIFWGFAAQKNQNPASAMVFFFGLLFWYYSGNALGTTGQLISEELMLGTFEQLLMTEAPIKRILVIRLAVQFIFQSLKAMIFFSLLMYLFDLWGLFAPLGHKVFLLYLVFLLAVLGLYGMGFAVAGLTLVFKQSAAVATILTYFILFFTGNLVQVDALPSLIKYVSLLIPVTPALRLLRIIIEAGEEITVGALVANRAFGILVLLILFWLGAGNFIFNKSMNRAKRKGNLGSYYF